MTGRFKSGQHSGTQDWRSIEQKTPHRGNPPARRVRSIWQKCLGLLVLASLVALLGSAGYGVYLLGQKSETSRVSAHSEPVGHIDYSTDGVLTREIMERLVSFPLGTALLEVDIHELKERLESPGQVREVKVDRIFPDRLSIEVRERVPVFQLRARIAGREERLLVGRTGAVYRGIGYEVTSVGRLPYLSGFRIREEVSGHFAPIDGLLPVVELMDALERYAPGVARSVEFVDCQEYRSESPNAEGSVIHLVTNSVPRIVFRVGDYGLQVSRLKGVLTRLEEARPGLAYAAEVDLSFSDRAVVLPRRELLSRNPSDLHPRL